MCGFREETKDDIMEKSECRDRSQRRRRGEKLTVSSDLDLLNPAILATAMVAGVLMSIGPVDAHVHCSIGWVAMHWTKVAMAL